MKSWLSKDIFEKPEDWPCNEREFYVECVKKSHVWLCRVKSLCIISAMSCKGVPYVSTLCI